MRSPFPRCRVLASIVFSLALATGAAAQRPAPQFRHLALEAGLSNPTVTAIAQDARGFMWVGTQDGVNVYDGVGFTVFRPVPGDTSSLADAWVSSLAPSRGGTVWVGLLGAGVHQLDPLGRRSRRFRHVPGNPASLASDKVNTMVETVDGTLWVGTGSGLDAVDTTTGIVRHYHPSTRADSGRFTDDVLAIVEMPDSTLWVGTRLGVYVLDRTTQRFRELAIPLLTREIRSMLLDTAGVVWIGAYDDIVAVDSRTERVLRQYRRRPSGSDAPIAHGVNGLARDRHGRIWIATNDGLAELDPASGEFARYRHDPRDPRSLAGPIARAVFVDHGGVLWVGLESHGLNKHSPSAVSFHLLRHDSIAERSLSDGYIRGIAEDRRGNIWIATQRGGLNRIDARTGRISAFRHRIPPLFPETTSGRFSRIVMG
jgi:ligand-binding sensor domain-containing protein